MIDLNLKDNFLDNAEKQALSRGLYDIPIMDADCHYMTTPMNEIAEYLEEPYRSRLRIYSGGSTKHIALDLGDRTVAGRMKSMPLYFQSKAPENSAVPKEIHPLMRANQKLAIDYSIVFPTDMLQLGLNPQSDIEVAIAYGAARWMTEKVLPSDDSLKTMLYLPFSDPEACVRMVEEFGDKKGVVGFMVTCVRYQPIYHNSYMPLYKLLEEKGLPLGFHTASYWMEKPLHQLNRFLSAHALGFPLYNMIQLTNLVINGIPERFPDLKFLFIEAGVSWIPFLMMRLDSDFIYRHSDAPLLSKRPSEYMKNFYFTSQPLEYTDNMKHLESIFEMFDAENQLLYASDYPHQDFDAPASIYDLPFLNEKAKRKILGENALKLFNIKEPVLHAKNRREQELREMASNRR
ncbi:amidohydrolase [Brevibacillus nitrificans]|uniref:Amidohydrolase n=1 Tax=Brevibacillus nitrificans TaxID=651560 RepID=A0A3M8CXV3_9BACL|nr:amidohydrolase family protein [Brevibacillus nitrificans]RNB80523.1 amidohydrolase [Brevibacillus nitrificans]